MDLETALLSAIVGFAGGVIASLGTKAFERRMGKELDEAEASRDLTVQLASALDGLEGFLQPLASDAAPKDQASLVEMHSGYDLPPLPLALEKLLTNFSSPEVHRLLLLLYNRLDLFGKRAGDYRAAYYWLLDFPTGGDWNAPAHRERLANMRVCREQMLVYVKDVLQYGYELIDRLLPGAESITASLMRGTAIPYLDFLKRKYGLTRVSAGLRRAYYLSRPGQRFSADRDDVIVVWEDGVTEALGGDGALLLGQITGEPCPRCIPAHVEVALPRRLHLTKLHLRRADGGQWLEVHGSLDRAFATVGPHRLRLPDDILAKLRSSREGCLTAHSANV